MTTYDSWIPDPIDGAALLDDVTNFLAKFVAFPSGAALTAVTLWSAHAHLIDASDNSPRLALLSPEPGSGKTRTLEVLELLTPQPMHSLSASPAAIFRTLNTEQPTLLMDEVDAIFGRRGSSDDGSEDLRALLNAGHRKGATIPRCVGPRHDVVKFPVYAAVALAGLGDLPDTLMSRAIIIRMRRRGPGERIQPFRRRVHESEGAKLCTELAEWCSSIKVDVADAWPQMPPGVEDRPQDVWEPLLAIADAAGSHWPELARSACVELCKVALSREASLGVQLLTDMRIAFGDADTLTTEAILDRLHQMDEAPWSDLRGKPIDARGLARRLRPYGVNSTKVKIEGRALQGYRREDLWEPWTRYLPPTPDKGEPPEPEEPGRSEHGREVPPRGPVPEPAASPEPGSTPLSREVPQVPQVPLSQGWEGQPAFFSLITAEPDEICPHGTVGGNQPDDFLKGKLRCTECRAEKKAS